MRPWALVSARRRSHGWAKIGGGLVHRRASAAHPGEVPVHLREAVSAGASGRRLGRGKDRDVAHPARRAWGADCARFGATHHRRSIAGSGVERGDRTAAALDPGARRGDLFHSGGRDSRYWRGDRDLRDSAEFRHHVSAVRLRAAARAASGSRGCGREAGRLVSSWNVRAPRIFPAAGRGWPPAATSRPMREKSRARSVINRNRIVSNC